MNILARFLCWYEGHISPLVPAFRIGEPEIDSQLCIYKCPRCGEHLEQR